MDIYYIPTVFFTLFFVVDPLGLIPVFLVYLAGFGEGMRRRIILKATLISISVSVFFIFLGRHLLMFLGISSGSFLVAGGILLFIIAIEMLLGQSSKIRMTDRCENGMPGAEEDVSVFPLAIPMLCGPGNIAALVMFGTQAEGDPARIVILALISVLVFLIAMVMMFFSVYIGNFLGTTGISIMQKLMGLVLSAMAVQFIRNGLLDLDILH